MLQKKMKLIIACLLTTVSLNLFSQMLEPVPIDPAIRYGKLENGLTYYVRHNENPKGRAEFYIAQNVGAILENDDQDGLAHFLEHMAFNGTKNFPKKGITEYFETIGVKFGTNINAYTSLDETVYNISNVPTAREGVIDTTLLVLHDWSSFLSLEGEEIDAERGVIREEWRTRQGADRRMWKEANKLKYPESQYAKRDIIGDTAIINNFDHQALRDFYHKWYRPDLQAILIVGDVDVDLVENKIKSIFSDIPRKSNYGERPIYPIHNNADPIIAIVTDREAQMTRIDLEYKHDKFPSEVNLSVNGYLLHTINSLISWMIATRFEEMSIQADAPFVAANGYYGELVKSKNAFTLMAIPHEGDELKALQTLLLEAEKIERFGFTNSEVERAKTNLMKFVEKAYNEKNNQRNNDLVREYIRHFLTDESIPGIEWEYEALRVMLPQISTDIINQTVQSYITEDNMIISILAPEKAEVKIPTEEQILTAIADAKAAELLPNEEEELSRPLIEKAPKPGKIKKSTYNASLGTTEWILSNGAKVIIKPTEFKQDEIILYAFSEGGMSKVDDVQDIPSAYFASSVVEFNGLKDFTLIDLQRMLTGKIANISPFINSYQEGFSGNSSVSDFETMMQLLYLYFTASRKDDNAFQAMLNMYKAMLVNKSLDPDAAFSDSVSVMLSDHNPRIILLDVNILDKISQDKALSIYKERFAAPADFTFVLTGNINPNDEQVKTIIRTYIGGLKSPKTTETYVDRNIRYPQGKVYNYFTKEMQVKKASNFISYTANIPYNLDNRTNMNAIASILKMRYLESIRENEGGSYGVGVAGSITNIPIDQAILRMQFDTDPEMQQKLMGVIHEEINKIVDEGPRAEDLQKVKENMLKQYEEDLDENGWWKNTLVTYYQDKISLPENYKASIDNLTAQSVQALLKTIVEQQNILEVVMMPAE